MITRLMAADTASYAGRYYQLHDAHLEPRPIQRPRIPILVAAHRPRMLRIAARYADQWDTFAECWHGDRRSHHGSRPAHDRVGRGVRDGRT